MFAVAEARLLLGILRILDQSLSELFEKAILVDKVFWFLLVGQDAGQ